MMAYNPYLQFLRYCLGVSSPLPESAKRIDWKKMMTWAESQAIIGVIYGGIEKAGTALNIPFDVLMEWIGYAQQIRNQNRLMNDRCVRVVDRFNKDGYLCCVLKGQGNALMYPNPFLRASGDIDLWIYGSKESRNREIREVVRYVRKRNPEGRATYHHIDFGDYEGVGVEVHYRPTYLYNFIINRRLQRWMNQHSLCEMVRLPDGEGHIPVPTWEFNVVYQLSHIYRHIMKEGVGMRQIIDYYYLLKRATDFTDYTDEHPMAEKERVLKHLGLMEIAGAVMWVLKEVLGMDERYLIVPVDERRGKFLLEEIMEGGNFGMYVTQKSQKPQKGCFAGAIWLNADTAIGRNILRLKRDMRLLRYFPSECLWEPVFRVWHLGWRVAHKF